MEVSIIVVLVSGVILDFIFGDPRWMPHIVRLIGLISVKGEALITKVLGRTIVAGLLLWVGVVASIILGYLCLSWILDGVHPYLSTALDIFILFQCIAYRDLVKHILAIKNGFQTNLEEARFQVSRIVGRDTNQMNEADVCRAAVESGSENLNDAVIAPLFWFVVFGPVGALLFRIANTMDAMVGHRNEKYELVGKFSARMDDLLNLIPARLCALFLLIAGRVTNWKDLRSDAVKHPSPNAGWPEVAMSRCLNVVLGGVMYANGKVVETAEMNVGAPQPGPSDLVRCIAFMRIAYLIAVGISVFVILWIAGR